ncbi:hypothetical protein GCK32_010820 [Trichostrongylus colubriformis]|uniref:Phlebovirus glycoprotein G2 fusion domain-containing protein n=1 Tax=Trichostrongylus colubriformis TaxID=6319 RepID=A0AAN8FK02_TRICO
MESSTCPAYAIECRQHGVYLHAPQSEEYELCVNNYCITGKSPPVHKQLHLPPEDTPQLRPALEATNRKLVHPCRNELLCSIILFRNRRHDMCSKHLESRVLATSSINGIRIYGVPKDDTVFELSRCIKWEEKVEHRLEVIEGNPFQIYVLGIHPNASTRMKGLEVTLNVLSPPPLPELDRTFITSGNHTAFWDERRVVLHCPSKGHAQLLQCTLHPVCECTPAKSQMMCKCMDDEIEATSSHIGNVLPLSWQQIHFSEHPHHAIMVKVDHDVSAEVILNMKETISDLTTEIKDDVCTAENTHLVRCFRCNKGKDGIGTAKRRVYKKTQTQERRHIDEIRYKRSCGRLAEQIRGQIDSQEDHMKSMK